MVRPATPPLGTPLADYQHYAYQNGAGVWRTVATTSIGLLVGLSLAYIAAFREKGVSTEEMHAYIKEFSPYAFDKQGLVDRNARQDVDIGVLFGKQDQIFNRLSGTENKEAGHDRDIAEIRTKQQILGDMLEAQRKSKP
jgi:hypothetical protein